MQIQYKKILISCNTGHGVPVAIALQKNGYEVHFATSIMFKNLPFPFVLSRMEDLRKKISPRIYPELGPICLTSIWSSEILFRLLTILKWGNMSKRYRISNSLFDYLVSRGIDEVDVFHFVNGIGLYSARKAKDKGKTIVLEQRAHHMEYDAKLVADEYNKFGLKYFHPEHEFKERIFEEQQIADFILVPSSFCETTFVNSGVDKNKLRVVNLGCNLERFRPSPEKRSDKFIILYVGRITVAKGIAYLLDSIKKARLKNYELWLVGDMDESCKRILNGRENEFIHIPQVPNPSLPLIYQQASVFVMPSLADAWGFVVIEAMACGLPVIVTESTGAKDAVVDNFNGFIVPAGDESAIAEKLELLSSDLKLREQMAVNCVNMAKRFSWEEYKNKLGSVYSEIIRA